MRGLKRALYSLLSGNYFQQEYLCVDESDFAKPFRFVIEDQGIAADISDKHLFLGYKPVTIGFPALPEMSFDDRIKIGVYSTEGKEVASLSLLLFKRIEHSSGSFLIYVVEKGIHSFVTPLQKEVQKIFDSLKRKSNNVNLPGNEYDQNRILYAIPRRISLVTLGKGGLFNLFPTDLHGKLNGDVYVDSLRHEGKAAQQLKETGRMVISHVHIDSYKSAYALGINHMQELRGAENFPFSSELSGMLSLPLPRLSLGYDEMELQHYTDVGIHRLHFLKIIHSQKVSSGNLLSHIHCTAANWRMKNKIYTKYYLR